MDRVRSDDLETVDCTRVGHGAVGRPAIELPDDEHDAPTGEVVRLTLDGTTRHALFDRYAGSVRATGAFDAPDVARNPGEGTNRLREWVEARELSTGRTVHLDVIEPGFAYGLRAPGEEAIYDAPSAPDDSLASIAEQLERDGE